MTAVVETHLRRRYQCSTCGRSWSKPRRAADHCADCVHDVDTRACPTCTFDHFGGGADEGADGCALGLRDDTTSCVRRCDGWIGKNTLLSERECDHLSADGVDEAEFGLGKVWRCLMCGALYRCEERAGITYMIIVERT